MLNLNGKIALVTGGATGIGRDVCKTLAAQGASVYVADLNAEGALHVAKTIDGQSFHLDVTDESSWHAATKIIDNEVGELDILVNSAGIMTVRPFLEFKLDDFRREHSVNVEGVWMGMQACFPLLLNGATRSGSASIINMSSIYGKVAGNGVAAYCATKGAVQMLSKAAALEFAAAGIRVNTVMPGAVDTKLLSGVNETVISMGMAKDEEEAKQIVSSTYPMDRIAQTEDIVGAVAFLASEQSKFMTGSDISIDGGFTAA